MALFVDLVALSNGLHGSVQMDSVALFSWIGWLRHRGILTEGLLKAKLHEKSVEKIKARLKKLTKKAWREAIAAV